MKLIMFCERDFCQPAIIFNITITPYPATYEIPFQCFALFWYLKLKVLKIHHKKYLGVHLSSLFQHKSEAAKGLEILIELPNRAIIFGSFSQS